MQLAMSDPDEGTSITTTTFNTSSAELVIGQLRGQLAKLQQDYDLLLEAAGGTTPTTTAVMPVVVVRGTNVKMKEGTFEAGTLAIVLGVMFFLWALPFMKPFKKCCETRRHRVVPIITIINILMLFITIHEFDLIEFNVLFFGIVAVISSIIDKVQTVLVAVLGAFILFVAWNFKDRILEFLGVDNPQAVIGDCRDWVTCWSMQRFRPMELHIWKVEDLPALKVSGSNDVFIEVTFGYNINMRTRVHARAGHSCIVKESMQLNFDPYDKEQRLHIHVRNQDILVARDISTLQLGANQIARMMESVGMSLSARTLGWGGTNAASEGSKTVWDSVRFKRLDLVPKGVIWLRFTPVEDEELHTPGSCCLL